MNVTLSPTQAKVLRGFIEEKLLRSEILTELMRSEKKPIPTVTREHASTLMVVLGQLDNHCVCQNCNALIYSNAFPARLEADVRAGGKLAAGDWPAAQINARTSTHGGRHGIAAVGGQPEEGAHLGIAGKLPSHIAAVDGGSPFKMPLAAAPKLDAGDAINRPLHTQAGKQQNHDEPSQGHRLQSTR